MRCPSQKSSEKTRAVSLAHQRSHRRKDIGHHPAGMTASSKCFSPETLAAVTATLMAKQATAMRARIVILNVAEISVAKSFYG